MISPCPPYYSSALSCLHLSDIEKLGCGCHTRAPKPQSVAAVTPGHPNQSLCPVCVGVQRREFQVLFFSYKNWPVGRRGMKCAFFFVCFLTLLTYLSHCTVIARWPNLVSQKQNHSTRRSYHQRVRNSLSILCTKSLRIRYDSEKNKIGFNYVTWLSFSF